MEEHFQSRRSSQDEERRLINLGLILRFFDLEISNFQRLDSGSPPVSGGLSLSNSHGGSDVAFLLFV